MFVNPDGYYSMFYSCSQTSVPFSPISSSHGMPGASVNGILLPNTLEDLCFELPLCHVYQWLLQKYSPLET